MSKLTPAKHLKFYDENYAKVSGEYDNGFRAFIMAETKTEKAYACHKPFVFRDGKNKHLPREQRYPKRLARFMDKLEKNSIPFCVYCLSATATSRAILIFEG